MLFNIELLLHLLLVLLLHLITVVISGATLFVIWLNTAIKTNWISLVFLRKNQTKTLMSRNSYSYKLNKPYQELL